MSLEVCSFRFPIRIIKCPGHATMNSIALIQLGNATFAIVTPTTRNTQMMIHPIVRPIDINIKSTIFMTIN